MTGIKADQDKKRPTPEALLEKAAAEWDATNKRLGLDVQKAAYEQFKKLPGSYADNTIDKIGLSPKLP